MSWVGGEWNINFNQMIAEQTQLLSCRAHIRPWNIHWRWETTRRANQWSSWSGHTHIEWVSLWSSEKSEKKLLPHILSAQFSNLMRRTEIAFCCHKLGMCRRKNLAFHSWDSPLQKIQFPSESCVHCSIARRERGLYYGLVSKILWLRILHY